MANPETSLIDSHNETRAVANLARPEPSYLRTLKLARMGLRKWAATKPEATRYIVEQIVCANLRRLETEPDNAELRAATLANIEALNGRE